MLKNRYIDLKEASKELEINERELLSRIEKGLIPAKRKDLDWIISRNALAEIKPFILVWRSPDYETFYSKVADTYIEPLRINTWVVEGMPEPMVVMREINRNICRKLRLTKAEKLLEIGCGCGLQALLGLKDRVSYYVGVDYSFNMIKKARHFLPSKSFCVGEAQNLPFKSNFFDRILCHSVMQYFPDFHYAKKAVLEFIRVCKPGGLILISDILSSQIEEKRKSWADYLFKRRRFYKWLLPQTALIMKKFLRLKANNNEKFFREFCHLEELNYPYDFFLRLQKTDRVMVEIFKDPYPIVTSYKRSAFEARIKKL